jgi:hypothetical protein
MTRYLIEVEITPAFGDPRFLLPNVFQKIADVGPAVRVVGRAVPVEESDSKLSKAQEAVALLNSMVLSGEAHSERSRAAVREALS